MADTSSDSSDSETDSTDKGKGGSIVDRASAAREQAGSVVTQPPGPPPPPPPPPPTAPVYQGGYAPPPYQGGYAPPPYEGGYAPPPPPPAQYDPYPSAPPPIQQKDSGGCCCVMNALFACIARCTLILTNTLLMILAILIGVIAYVLIYYVGTSDKVQAKLKEFGIDKDVQKEVNPYAYFFGYIGWGFAVMSIMCCFTGFIGYCGALCANRSLLKVYVIILNVSFVVMLITTITIYWNKSIGKSKLQETLQSYSGIGGTSAKETVWNVMMIELECCGADNYKDFQNLPNWPNKTLGIPDQITPIACCKYPKEAMKPSPACATKSGANDKNNNMNKGCYEIMFEFVFGNRSFKIVLVSLHLAMAVQLLLGWWIISDIDNDNLQKFNAKKWGQSHFGNRGNP